jgi:hypothetical protein
MRNLWWVPYILSEYQKWTKVEMSQTLLRALRIQATRSWHDIITLDESWFCFKTNHEFFWLAQGKEITKHERHIVQSLTMMIAIVWTPTDFDIINVLLKSGKFNAYHYISVIPQILAD